MAINPPIDRALELEAPQRRTAWTASVREFCVRRPLGAIGAAIIVLMLVVALGAPLIARYDPVVNDFGAMLSAPSRAHWLGTDNSGYDVFTRLLHGARLTLLTGVLAVVLSLLVGVPGGMLSGWIGGRVDGWAMRVVDVLLAFPSVVLAIAALVTTAKLALTAPSRTRHPRCNAGRRYCCSPNPL